jgi:hypothetical protein
VLLCCCAVVLLCCNRDRNVINPAATSPLHLAMFEFVGVLMGVACRTRFPLPLYLPALVRPLCSVEPPLTAPIQLH